MTQCSEASHITVTIPGTPTEVSMEGDFTYLTFGTTRVKVEGFISTMIAGESTTVMLRKQGNATMQSAVTDVLQEEIISRPHHCHQSFHRITIPKQSNRHVAHNTEEDHENRPIGVLEIDVSGRLNGDFDAHVMKSTEDEGHTSKLRLHGDALSQTCDYGGPSQAAANEAFTARCNPIQQYQSSTDQEPRSQREALSQASNEGRFGCAGAREARNTEGSYSVSQRDLVHHPADTFSNTGFFQTSASEVSSAAGIQQSEGDWLDEPSLETQEQQIPHSLGPSPSQVTSVQYVRRRGHQTSKPRLVTRVHRPLGTSSDTGILCSSGSAVRGEEGIQQSQGGWLEEPSWETEEMTSAWQQVPHSLGSSACEATSVPVGSISELFDEPSPELALEKEESYSASYESGEYNSHETSVFQGNPGVDPFPSNVLHGASTLQHEEAKAAPAWNLQWNPHVRVKHCIYKEMRSRPSSARSRPSSARSRPSSAGRRLYSVSSLSEQCRSRSSLTKAESRQPQDHVPQQRSRVSSGSSLAGQSRSKSSSAKAEKSSQPKKSAPLPPASSQPSFVRRRPLSKEKPFYCGVASAKVQETSMPRPVPQEATQQAVDPEQHLISIKRYELHMSRMVQATQDRRSDHAHAEGLPEKKNNDPVGSDHVLEEERPEAVGLSSQSSPSFIPHPQNPFNKKPQWGVRQPLSTSPKYLDQSQKPELEVEVDAETSPFNRIEAFLERQSKWQVDRDIKMQELRFHHEFSSENDQLSDLTTNKLMVKYL